MALRREHSEEVTQPVHGALRARFVKELLRVPGPPDLSLVRKALPEALRPAGGLRGAALLVHGFGQNRYAWHLSGRSLANALALAGYDVFNLDLRGHGRSRFARGALEPHAAPRGIDPYVREDLPRALAAVREASGFARPFVLGHSLGALVAGAALGRGDEPVAGLAALAVPFHFSRGSRTLRAFSAAVRAAVPEGRAARAHEARVPVSWVGRAIELTRPAWQSALVPLPVRAFAPGSLSDDEAREYLRRSFDSASLGSLRQLVGIAGGDGALRSFDGREDYSAAFAAQRAPLLVVAGARDQLATPEAVRPAFEASRASDKTYLEFDDGHGDLLVGQRAPERLWPALERWLRARG